MKELIGQLKSLRHEDVNPNQEWLGKNRDFLLARIKNITTVDRLVPSRSFCAYYKLWSGISMFLPRNFVFKVVRPATAMLLILGLGTGGWIATVGAAQSSLPGDLLYPVVRVDEMTRAGFVAAVGATGTETKMRVGFAKRRAEETKKLVSTNDQNKIKQVPGVVRDLKKEIEKVNNNLQEVEKQDSDSKVKAEVVSSINKETKEIKNILTDVRANLNVSSSTNSQTAVSEVELANSAVKETAVKAVEVLVAKHLQGDDSVSKQEVKQAIKSQIESTAKETVINKNVLETVKEEVKAAVTVSTSTTGTISLADAVAATTTGDNAQAGLEKNKLNKAGLEEVAKKTAEAAAAVQQATTEVNKKVSQAEKLLAEDNLNQAVKVAREVSDVAKKAEQTTKETVESAQAVVPTVMADAVSKGVAVSAATTSASMELKNKEVSSTTVQAGVATGTAKQTETTTIIRLPESR